MDAVLPPVALSDELIEWLRKLDADIFGESYQVSGPGPGPRDQFQMRHERRSLTEEEWAEVVRIAPAFMVVPGNTPYGFNFAIYIYLPPTHRDPPIFPGLPDPFPKPELICCIYGRHMVKAKDRLFAGAWELMSPLTHNPENIQKLLACGMEQPKSCDYYAY